MTPKLHFWPTPLQAFALVTSLRLELQQLWVVSLLGARGLLFGYERATI